VSKVINDLAADDMHTTRSLSFASMYERTGLFECTVMSSISVSSCFVRLRREDVCHFHLRLPLLRLPTPYVVVFSTEHDYRGSPATKQPTNGEHDESQFSCFKLLLDNSRLKFYLVSSHMSDFTHPKLVMVPIGLGDTSGTFKMGVGRDEVLRQLHILQERAKWNCSHKACALNMLGVSLNTEGNIAGMHRSQVLRSLRRIGIFSNHYPTDTGIDILSIYSKSVFVVSPRGIHYDCWRHFEALISGAFVLADYHPSILRMYEGLPVMFVKDWDSLRVADLVKFIGAQVQRDDYHFKKLFASYWSSQMLKELVN